MTWEVKTGHTIEELAKLKPESVQSCVTSPPYWGLRDYGDKGQQWPAVSYSPMAGLPLLEIPEQVAALGLEPDPAAYVGHLVEVFRAVRRVLRDDGTLWLNLGDSYNAQQGQQRISESTTSTRGGGHKAGTVEYQNTKRPTPAGLKPKDLCGIPWRVAFALQADGWYLRSDIIWHKPNPMPESVTDRPTKAHEYLFLLTKSARYFYDADAIRVAAPNNKPRSRASNFKKAGQTMGADGGKQAGHTLRGAATIEPHPIGRNRRSVWTIATSPYSGAHFAVMPPSLVEPCIKAGSRIGDRILDPFSGAGTTGLIAKRLRRDYIGTEQSEKYAEISRRRIEGDSPLFNRQEIGR
jgi:DNA modification methylase